MREKKKLLKFPYFAYKFTKYELEYQTCSQSKGAGLWGICYKVESLYLLYHLLPVQREKTTSINGKCGIAINKRSM